MLQAEMVAAVRGRLGVSASDPLATTAIVEGLLRETVHRMDAESVNGWYWNRGRFETLATIADETYGFSQFEDGDPLTITKIIEVRIYENAPF